MAEASEESKSVTQSAVTLIRKKKSIATVTALHSAGVMHVLTKKTIAHVQ